MILADNTVMTVVPHFLLKRIYCAGSLRNTEGGVSFDFKNILGPGHVTQLNEVMIGDASYSANQIAFICDGESISADTITADNAYKVLMNKTVTVQIQNLTLESGSYKVFFDLVTPEAGHIRVSIDDKLN